MDQELEVADLYCLKSTRSSHPTASPLWLLEETMSCLHSPELSLMILKSKVKHKWQWLLGPPWGLQS